MATFFIFNSFYQALAEKKHQLSTDSFKLALCAAANPPSQANDNVLADLTQISYANLSTRDITTASSSTTGAVYTLKFNDLTLSASVSDAAGWRYATVYNTTAPSSELMGFFDYGSDIIIEAGQDFDFDFGADGGTDGTILTLS